MTGRVLVFFKNAFLEFNVKGSLCAFRKNVAVNTKNTGIRSISINLGYKKPEKSAPVISEN